MYPARYIRYFNLPLIPGRILSQINFDLDQYEKRVSAHGVYTWSDSFNQELDAWCKENICADMYYAFQIIRGDLPLHRDKGTKTKLIYLLQNGGDQVRTEFLDDDESTVLQSEIVPTHRWHVMKVDTLHRVIGVDPKKIRFSIVSRIFE